MPAPPAIAENRAVTRRIRFVKAAIGGAQTYTFTPANIAAQDAADYGLSTSTRFGQLRASRIEAWYAPVALATLTSPDVSLVVTDQISGAYFRDGVNAGVDYAHVALRASLHTRMFWRPAANTDVLFTVSVEGLGSVTTATGTLYVDITFDAT